MSYADFRAEQLSNFIFLIQFYILGVAFLAITIFTLYITCIHLTKLWYMLRSTRTYHKIYRSLTKGAKR